MPAAGTDARSRYFSGTLLESGSFALEQRYLRRRRRTAVWLELDAGSGFEPWYEVGDLSCSRARDRHFVLDAHGVLRFGDGRRGRRPPAGARVRGWYRYGAGRAGDAAPSPRELAARLAEVSHFSWMRQAARDKRGVRYERLDPEPTAHDRERAEDAVAELRRLGLPGCPPDDR